MNISDQDIDQEEDIIQVYWTKIKHEFTQQFTKLKNEKMELSVQKQQLLTDK